MGTDIAACSPELGGFEVLRVTAPAKGGDGLARDAAGRVVFVSGALPGELVRARITAAHRDYRRGEAVEVLEPSAQRVEVSCPSARAGCGGCDLLHLAPNAHLGWKRAVVEDALRRIGRLNEMPEVAEVPLPPAGYRTTVRCVVEGDRAGYRRRRGHEAVSPEACSVLHPMLEELVCEGRFPGAAEVTLRVGARTGERLALVKPSAAGARLPGDVRVVGADELAAGRRAWIHEELVGRRFRISARSFFQVRPDGAEVLARLVVTAAEQVPGRLADLYAGVGLFAVTAGEARSVVAVERSRSSVADARVNLAGRHARVVACDVDRWTPCRCEVVVADPARSGLGRAGARVVAGTGASRVILVSCDPAALARDVRLLAGHGFEVQRVDVVDLFGGTSHVEAVTVLDR